LSVILAILKYVLFGWPMNEIKQRYVFTYRSSTEHY
jgi:hypothetical protein